MIPSSWYLANQYFTGDFAKFNNWNESIYLSLCDELTREEIQALNLARERLGSANALFTSCLKSHHDEIVTLLETFKGYGTIPTDKRNTYVIYATIILCQYARGLYAHVLEDIQSSSEFKEYRQPSAGNASLALNALDFLMFVPDEINYWPFSDAN
ncbi:hypothetical protein FOT62_22645 [Serratia marcescens]|uniref:Uncharacterized protein n=1 Tax=Serratia marcescens TaxID=615 RepID=A0A5C7BRV0_SERMA|nr:MULTISPECIES: hypothetical protein [Serratia]TXE27121.1 hypothetical protein FOT62_22645 [Serratia marcescens]TXE55322.1 hypothetical protein FOT56_25520 [Serratia marcescens]